MVVCCIWYSIDFGQRLCIANNMSVGRSLPKDYLGEMGKKLKFNKSKEGASKSAADSVMHSFADIASTIATALKPSAGTPLSSKSAGSPPSS